MGKQTTPRRGKRGAPAVTGGQGMPRPDEVTQATLHLHPFEADVPAITTADGTEYIPIRALCTLMGLSPSPWIANICTRYRGDDSEHVAVRRLPYRQPASAVRAEWCLDRDHVLRWFTFHLHPRHVPPGQRRDQLLAFQQQMMDAAGAIYERGQEDFHSTKREVIRRLRACATTLDTLNELDAAFGPHVEHSAPTEEAGRAARAAFVAFIAQGRQLQERLAEALRELLQEMTSEPVIDGLLVDDATGEVVDTVAMPILPQVPDLGEVNRLADVAQRWFTEDLVEWLRAHGFSATFRESDVPQEDK